MLRPCSLTQTSLCLQSSHAPVFVVAQVVHPKGKANLIWQMQIHKMCFERLTQCNEMLHISLHRSTNVLNFFCQVDVERESNSLNWEKRIFTKTGFKAKPDQTQQ